MENEWAAIRILSIDFIVQQTLLCTITSRVLEQIGVALKVTGNLYEHLLYK